jgi:hypothetical protein
MNTANASPRKRFRSRAGMTVIVVLGVLSITLALSYAMLRSQVTSVQIQSNLDRRNAARQAAYAGISAALRKMHDMSWGGVDSTLNQTLSDNQWFEVSFETGDSSLTSSSADYSEYPFRVMIHSTGFAADPDQPDSRSTYRVRAVVQLIRKKLYDPPAAWTTIRDYTSFQWSGGTSMIEFPARVVGPVWSQNAFNFSSDYPSDSTSRTQYLGDLNALRANGLGDHRVFNGPISTPHTKQTAATLTLMQTTLGWTVTNVATATSQPISFPSATSSYQLYPGGRAYTIPTLQTTYGSTLSGVTITPDPVTNPLGIYLSSGPLNISSNVKIQGTVVAASGTEPDLRILGSNVTLAPNILPLLDGSTTQYQLPVALVKDDFYVYGTADATLTGAVVAWDEFAFVKGSSAARFDMKGRVASSRLNLNGRDEWDLPLVTWQVEWNLFNAQKLLAGGIPYYPQWLQTRRGMTYTPRLTIQPETSGVIDHWHTWGQPVYQPGTGDAGLKWDVVDWVDNPADAANDGGPL